MVHFTPLQRLLSINCGESEHCLLYMPKIFHELFILLQFLKLIQT